MKERGAALLEFAIALPAAITLFAGIGDFSAFFWRQTQMEAKARIVNAEIARNPDLFMNADAAALLEQARSLQETAKVAVAISRHYACPRPGGDEAEATSEPQNCPAERIYLRIVETKETEPILAPLSWLGYPKATFSRHVIRLR